MIEICGQRSAHPYLRLPLQFAASLRLRLEALLGSGALDELLVQVERELSRSDIWGTTVMLVQPFARVPS